MRDIHRNCKRPRTCHLVSTWHLSIQNSANPGPWKWAWYGTCHKSTRISPSRRKRQSCNAIQHAGQCLPASGTRWDWLPQLGKAVPCHHVRIRQSQQQRMVRQRDATLEMRIIMRSMFVQKSGRTYLVMPRQDLAGGVIAVASEH